MNLKVVWAELAQYPRGVIEEIRKVDWPSRHATVQLTIGATIIIALATAYVGVLDIVFARIVQMILTQ